MPDARGAAAPHPAASGAPKVFAELAPPTRGYTHPGSTGELCPFCRNVFNELMTEYERRLGEGDRARQGATASSSREKDRIGIGTFQPKDEKNQDSTELTGDINYRKIAEYGSDSDPRAFNFDGELNIANRGIVEFIEVLKLDVAFLYDLLGASQEHKIKPKKFAQTDIDEVILGHTNEPEYKQAPEQRVHGGVPRPHGEDRRPVHHPARATRSRSTRRTSTPSAIKGKHIAPHTIEMAAMWAVLTRLEEPKKANLTLLQKLKLYNGKTLPGFTEDNVKELKQGGRARGHGGHQPALHPGQDLQRAGRRHGRGLRQPVHGAATSWRRACGTTR